MSRERPRGMRTEADCAAVSEVQQPARGRHQHMRLLVKQLDLHARTKCTVFELFALLVGLSFD